MRISASFVLTVLTQCIWSGRALNPMVGILVDMKLGFPATDQLAAVAVMACHHIQTRDSRLVSSELSADFNITCNFVDHSLQSRTQVAEAALHWSAIGANFMVGAYTSDATIPLAVLGGLYEIPVVGFMSPSDFLSDKQAYAYYGRTNPAALAVPRSTMKFISAMGWSNFAFIYVDSPEGNSNNNAFHKFAREDGLQVLSSQSFTSGDADSIRFAVKGLASSGARILIIGTSPQDSLVIMEAADEEGIIGPGYTWFSSVGDPANLFRQSKNVTRTVELVSGWMFIRSDPFAEETLRQRFDDVWKGEVFEDVAIADVDNVVHRPLPPTVNDADCFIICGYIYDAVWTAALAMDRSVKADSGELVPAEVLAAWRELEFEGATGNVLFDDKLDRGSGVPMVLVNWVPVEASDGSKSIQMTDIASWEDDTGVLERYEFADRSAPAWAGGGRGWDAVPADGSACAKGQVLFLTSLQCEPCPPGSFQNGTRCDLCPTGYHAPDPAMLQCIACLESGYAAREGMVQCTPCAGHYEMPPGSIAHTSDRDCVCSSGYIAGCSWPVWQLLVVVIAAMVAAVLAYTAWRRCRVREEGQQELRQRGRLLRSLLRLRREDGFRFTTEPRSWAQLLGLAPHHLIRARPLKHLALLSLLRRFDIAAVDSLSVLFEALDEQLAIDAETRTDSLWGDGEGEGASYYAGSASSRRRALVDNQRQLTLCNIIIHVSCQLLDPRRLEPQGGGTPERRSSQPMEVAGAASHELLPVAVPDTLSPEERFIFFRDFVAQLQVWEGGETFTALKARLQHSLDALRSEMDALYDTLVAEDGGRELVAWNPPVAHHEGDAGPIQRQDHPCVMAIYFHQYARKQVVLFKEASGRQHVQEASGDRMRKRSDTGFQLQSRSRSRSRSRSAFTGGNSFVLASPRSTLPVLLSSPVPSIRTLAGSVVSSSGTGPNGPDGGVGEWLWQPCQFEQQFVEQLHLQSCLLNEGFQHAVQDSMHARTLELEQRSSLEHTRAGDDALHGPADAADSELPPSVQVLAGGIKTVKRMMEKVKTYAEEARSGKAELVEPYTAHVLDPVRACVICRNSRDLLETAQWMLDNGTRCGLPAVRVKNKFAVKDSSEYDGYRDLMLSVLHTGALGLRIVGEIQFHDERMYALKVQMHRLYKVKRSATAATI